MKSRSEILAERKAAAASSEKPKQEAQKGAANTIYCKECDETFAVADLTRREDGKYECGSCAMPLSPMTKERALQLASEGGTIRTEPLDKAIASDAKKAKGENTARSSSYCGECGAEWPLINGKIHMNCGHVRALRVDDPRKANAMKATTASGAPNPPAGPPSMHVVPPNVSMTIEGNSLRMAWGKAIFPVGELLGQSKFSNMEIGPFSLTETYDSARHDEIVGRMLANLQQMADRAFDVQLLWFKEKLGLIK